MTITFPDVSHYQAGLNLSGAVACIAKATQGTGYVDTSYQNFKTQAARLGIPFAAYHWLDTTSATAQAQHAYSVVGADTPLMIDDEQGKVNVPHTLEFVVQYRKLGGLVVLEYVPHWIWEASGFPSLAPLATVGLKVVASNYPAAGYSDAGPGWQGYGGILPTVWQYTDKQLFNGQRVDFNAFRGTVDQFRALLSGGNDMAAGVWNQSDINLIVFTILNGGEGQALHYRLQVIRDMLKLIASKVDITPDELASIEASAKAGAEAAITAAIPVLVQALVAELPAGAMTPAQVEQAVRNAFAHGLAE